VPSVKESLSNIEPISRGCGEHKALAALVQLAAVWDTLRWGSVFRKKIVELHRQGAHRPVSSIVK
jgi:hypothetical protein